MIDIDAILTPHLQDIRAGHDGKIKAAILSQLERDILELVGEDDKPYIEGGPSVSCNGLRQKLRTAIQKYFREARK
jgi:hypothetical protein